MAIMDSKERAYAGRVTMNKRRIRVTLLGVMLFLGSVLTASTGADSGQSEADIPSAPAAAPVRAGLALDASPRTSVPAVLLRAASGASISFSTQNGEMVNGASPETLDLPHLVLHRNGALTDPAERTLVVQVTGIEVPPGGVTVTLSLETQHGDPDMASGSPQRISVWHESRRIANTMGVTQTGVSTVWEQEFGERVLLGARMIATPTDYFRWALVVTDAAHPPAHPLYTSSQDYAFLMEDQWIAPLPQVAEASVGAAPDELIVYYCDMFPFGSAGDRTTWLRREQIAEYVHSQLVPAMVEAFRIQTDEWGFPWYEEWTSYRSGPDMEQLSMALSDGQTWFHGKAPGLGNASISINVNRSSAEYDTLTDGLMSTFHHELFHNLQRNIFQHYGGDVAADRASTAWDLITEGTAVLASSVGQADLQFSRTWGLRAYAANAGRFVGSAGVSEGDLNRSYGQMNPYHAAAYWRFLYEQCGGMVDGVENRAGGLAVIRRILVALSRDVADASRSMDLVERLPGIMDKALDGSSCPFRTYDEGLQSFARAIYELRLDRGRCVEPGVPMGCGFYDPEGLYPNPPAHTIIYTGTMTVYAQGDQPDPAGIPSSFGIDLVDVALDPSLDGRPLVIELYGATGAESEFTVQVWYLMDLKDGAQPRPVATQAVPPAVRTEANPNARTSLFISRIDMARYNRLGLVISRIDDKERLDPSGRYTIALHTAQ
jgi:hypothetical protein